MGKQKFTSEIEVTGASKAAADFAKVDKAQKGVTDQGTAAVEQTKAATEATDKLSASESDFIGVLSRINPALGGLADALLKGGKIAGDLASQNISLSGAFAKATGAIKANAGALKLIGAGGAVVLAIAAIAGAMARMREEALAVTAAIRDQVDALNDLQKQRSSQSENLERMSARRREGPLTADETTAASQAVVGLGNVAGVTARQQAVLLGGTGLDKEILQRLAVLLEQFPGQVDFERSIRHPLESRLAFIERRLASNAAPLDVIIARETQQRGETVGAAVGQARAGSGATASIADFIKNMPGRGMEGVDVAQLAQIVQGLQNLPPEALGEFSAANIHVSRPPVPGLGGGGKDVFSKTFGDLQLIVEALKREGVEGATPALVRSAEFILQALMQAARKLEEAADKLSQPGVGGVTYNNSKFLGPDAASDNARMVNAETRSRYQSERMLQ